jgi:hypothetical protein
VLIVNFTGIAPSLLPDADDTAKTILMLCLLDRPVSPDRMIAEFEAETHFQTYKLERNASFSANCNVLGALLHVENPVEYTQQITKAVTFLCKFWMAGDVKDKWVRILDVHCRSRKAPDDML